MESLKMRWVGTSPILLHNGLLADPLSPGAQALKGISSKRKKTEADLDKMRELEFLAGLYQDASGRVCIPADNVLKCIVEGARKNKQGKEAQSGVVETQSSFPLIYDGPQDPMKLYQNPKFVSVMPAGVQRARVMRTRPIFDSWAIEVSVFVNDDIINLGSVVRAAEIAGERIGLCDYRPRYGRFSVEVVS